MRCSSFLRSYGSKVVVPAGPKPLSLTRKLYHDIMRPGATPTELVSLANALAPRLSSTRELSVAQEYHILKTLSSRSVRHEGVLQKCIWDILKATLKDPECDGGDLFNRQLAACTGSTFDIMTRMGFHNDPQMTALALGRCVELIPLMPLAAVVQVYRGLAQMNRAFFSISSAALCESDVTEDFTLVDQTVDEGGEATDSRAVANQPNLVDVLCGELENRLLELSVDPSPLCLDVDEDGAAEKTHRAKADAKAWTAVARRATDQTPGGGNDRAPLLLLLVPLTHALSVLGATSPGLFVGLQSLFNLARVPPKGRHLTREDRALAASSLIAALHDAAGIGERVIDPMNHTESAEFATARASLTASLAAQLSRVPGVLSVFQHRPSLVLSARAVFERMPELADGCPELWDQVRVVRVAQKHVLAAKAPGRASSSRLGGKLWDKRFAVKVKPIMQDLSRAEQFVPPQFKTWRSPVHKPRGGHVSSSRGPAKVMRFGTRRITKDYLKDKRKKYSQRQ